jgi:hypothetical protein
MKKALLLLLVTCAACFNKQYTYVEVSDSGEEKTEAIKAESDSAAYIAAYRKFCIAEKVYYQTLKEYNYDVAGLRPMRFMLLNDGGEDITNSVYFVNKLEWEQSTRRSFDIERSMRESSGWKYSEEINEMDDSKTFFAQIDAIERLYFDFPYNGGAKASLVIRKNSRGTDVMLLISQGQFLSSYSNNNHITVRFDDKKPEIYSFSEPTDHRTTMIFISNTKKFISGLKEAKQTLIQCEFYQEGLRTMKFMTEDLEWRH